MEYNKASLYHLATTVDAKSCRVFMLLWGKSDFGGCVDTSLSQLHNDCNLAVTTIRRALAELEKAGYLKIEHDLGIKAYYQLLLPEEFKEVKDNV